MKALLQVVENCTLTVKDDKNYISHIDKGILILLGVNETDTQRDAAVLSKKIATLRIFHDNSGKMNLSCIDDSIDGRFMVVSQFTLYGNCTHGRRPDMFSAAKPEIAEPLYEKFTELLNLECKKESGKDIDYTCTGKFGADMRISFTNVGPETFIIESKDLK